MAWYSIAKRVATGGIAGGGGPLKLNMPRVVSGVAARGLPSAMKMPAPALGLKQRVQIAMRAPGAQALASRATGAVVGVKSAMPKRRFRFW